MEDAVGDNDNALHDGVEGGTRDEGVEGVTWVEGVAGVEGGAQQAHCAEGDELRRLKEENARLKEEIERLRNENERPEGADDPVREWAAEPARRAGDCHLTLTAIKSDHVQQWRQSLPAVAKGAAGAAGAAAAAGGGGGGGGSGSAGGGSSGGSAARFLGLLGAHLHHTALPRRQEERGTPGPPVGVGGVVDLARADCSGLHRLLSGLATGTPGQPQAPSNAQEERQLCGPFVAAEVRVMVCVCVRVS